MKNNTQKLPKKEVRSLYTFKVSKSLRTETSTSGDTSGTCTTATTTTHFNR